MDKKFKVRGVALLSLVLGLSAIPMANANDSCAPASVSTKVITPSDLDEQRTELEATVSSAVANGQLTDFQSDSVRAKLNQNCKLQTSYLSDGVLDVSEAQEVRRNLGGIADSMQDSMRATVAANAAAFEGAVMASTPNNTNISTSRFYKYGFGQNFVDGGPDIATNVANYNNKELCLSAQLESGRSDGRLTGTEYFFLKGKLNDVAARTQQIADLRRKFTWDEQDKMNGKINDLQANLSSHLVDNEIATVDTNNAM